jgi:hypothetical protein
MLGLSTDHSTTRELWRAAIGSLLVLLFPVARSGALQAPIALAAGASAIGLLTRSTNIPAGRTLTEAYLTQPMLTADVRAAWLHALGTLNLEGLTLRRGELELGEWGEGYVDRRHPHSYIHEFMAGAEVKRKLAAGSLYAGRGFVPFGSDDPMVRPFVSYPVDHHLAQILERVVLIGAARVGPITAEAATFNGDEPLDPSAAPRFSRFGDSWALRGTVDGGQLSNLLRGAELSASYAAVKSPEYRDGRGLDQKKAHASLRLTGSSGAYSRYALLELARTTDVDRGRTLYTFDAVLAEAAVCRGRTGVALRWERSDRPEEERLLDLFRAPRPATDVSVLGVTRWTTLTGAIALPTLQAGVVGAAPFLEAARLTVDRTSAALFDPALFYGATSMWRLAGGLRLAAGRSHGRMGRYGTASGSADVGVSRHDHRSSNRCFS